ncbi:uncharacterized protein LOC122011866 isoform X1 [Zingiber officinale]|uniref:uncharacterized protein LOC122011866 isoform X1 n=1 Tax=Zingiber officinale TaxID=94328 RepID=UPI001C4C40BA|nr:uncharacterized protein LOC122011866 isoform X1 [Zingiber officinale]XP_042424209.1 uncharacterized protein LOC122011866 isoform X1 [Zingiber officinale]
MESSVKHERSTPTIVENILKNVALEDLDILSINENDELIIGELGQFFNGILHVGDSYKVVSDSDLDTDQDETYAVNQVDITPMDDNKLEDFNKHASGHLMEYLQSPPSQDTREPLSITRDVENAENPSTTPKLISALKGSRAQIGMQSNTKLTVKWAPDVYDPPVTSDCHTVKGHHRRYKIIKKEPRKQKHSKNKSYKISSHDRKSLSQKGMDNIDSGMMMSSPKTLMLKSFNILSILTCNKCLIYSCLRCFQVSSTS